MLLARKGYRVLVVDRATFPSDTFRNHVLLYPAVSKVQSWGLLDRIAATNCPPIRLFTQDMGDFPLTGRVLVDQVPKEIMESGFLDGTTSVQPYDPSVDTPANRAFVEKFRKTHDVPPILISFESYEATKVLIDAIRRAGSADPGAIRDALATTKLPSMLGTTIEFDANNLAHNYAVILTIKGGKVVVLGLSKT